MGRRGRPHAPRYRELANAIIRGNAVKFLRTRPIITRLAMNHTYDIKNPRGSVCATVVLSQIVSVQSVTDMSGMHSKVGSYGFEVLLNGGKVAPCLGDSMDAKHARLLLLDVVEEYQEAARILNGGTPDNSGRAQLKRSIIDRRKLTRNPYACDCAVITIEESAHESRRTRGSARMSALIQAVEGVYHDSIRKDEILEEAAAILGRFDESSEL